MTIHLDDRGAPWVVACPDGIERGLCTDGKGHHPDFEGTGTMRAIYTATSKVLATMDPQFVALGEVDIWTLERLTADNLDILLPMMKARSVGGMSVTQPVRHRSGWSVGVLGPYRRPGRGSDEALVLGFQRHHGATGHPTEVVTAAKLHRGELAQLFLDPVMHPPARKWVGFDHAWRRPD